MPSVTEVDSIQLFQCHTKAGFTVTITSPVPHQVPLDNAEHVADAVHDALAESIAQNAIMTASF